jgi:hypothetical protein
MYMGMELQLVHNPGTISPLKKKLPTRKFCLKQEGCLWQRGRVVSFSFLTINIRCKSISYTSRLLDLTGNNPRSHRTSGWVSPTHWREMFPPKVRQDRPLLLQCAVIAHSERPFFNPRAGRTLASHRGRPDRFSIPGLAAPWLLTAEARVRSHASLHGIYGRRSGARTGFHRLRWFSPVIIIPSALYSIIVLIHSSTTTDKQSQ